MDMLPKAQREDWKWYHDRQRQQCNQSRSHGSGITSVKRGLELVSSAQSTAVYQSSAHGHGIASAKEGMEWYHNYTARNGHGITTAKRVIRQLSSHGYGYGITSAKQELEVASPLSSVQSEAMFQSSSHLAQYFTTRSRVESSRRNEKFRF